MIADSSNRQARQQQALPSPAASHDAHKLQLHKAHNTETAALTNTSLLCHTTESLQHTATPVMSCAMAASMSLLKLPRYTCSNNTIEGYLHQQRH